MTEKELNSVRELNKKIRDLERRLHELRISAENLVPIIDGLPHSSEAKSRVEKLALMIVEHERDLEKFRDHIILAKSELVHTILREVDEPTLQALLMLRYVECLSFKETARRMKFTLRHLYRLHEKIFKNVTLLHSCALSKG
ncbi:MAG: hypothetical protein IJL14_00925 [Selenomonadaceae bacterium]|nr:hypothetical protein [Selenomonadaceae bacterium]